MQVVAFLIHGVYPLFNSLSPVLSNFFAFIFSSFMRVICQNCRFYKTQSVFKSCTPNIIKHNWKKLSFGGFGSIVIYVEKIIALEPFENWSSSLCSPLSLL